MKKQWKRMVTSMMCGMMLLGTGNVASAAEYPDVTPKDWHYEYVKDVSEKGYMSGYTNNGKFGPNDKLTRGQFATILWRMENSPEVTYDNKFPDVKGDEFYGKAVAWASEKGIITGYTNNGKFGPNDSLNREQMATMLYRYDGSPKVNASSYKDFPDADKVSEFAQDGMAYAVDEKIVTGDKGKLVPQGTVVRAVCATMISRLKADETVQPPVDPQPEPEKPQPPVDPQPEPEKPQPPVDPQPEPELNIEAWAEKNGFVSDEYNIEYVKTENGIEYHCSYGSNPIDPKDTPSRWHIWVEDGKSASGNVVIPESMDGIVVDGIGYGAFINNKEITEITIPKTITQLSPNAFDYTMIKTYTFGGEVPDGFNAIRPNEENFTIRHPKDATSWNNLTFVFEYEPTFIAY